MMFLDLVETALLFVNFKRRVIGERKYEYFVNSLCVLMFGTWRHTVVIFGVAGQGCWVYASVVSDYDLQLCVGLQRKTGNCGSTSTSTST